MEDEADVALLPLFAESNVKNDVRRVNVIRLSRLNPPHPIRRLIPPKPVPNYEDWEHSSTLKDDTNRNANIFYTVKPDRAADPTRSSKYKRFHIDDAFLEANSKRTRLVIRPEPDGFETTLDTTPKDYAADTTPKHSAVKVLVLYGVKWLHVQSIPVLKVYFYGSHDYKKLHADNKDKDNLMCKWINVDDLCDTEYNSANKALTGFIEHFGLKKKGSVWNNAFSIDKEGTIDIKAFNSRNKSFKHHLSDE